MNWDLYTQINAAVKLMQIIYVDSCFLRSASFMKELFQQQGDT